MGGQGEFDLKLPWQFKRCSYTRAILDQCCAVRRQMLCNLYNLRNKCINWAFCLQLLPQNKDIWDCITDTNTSRLKKTAEPGCPLIVSKKGMKRKQKLVNETWAKLTCALQLDHNYANYLLFSFLFLHKEGQEILQHAEPSAII